MKEQKDKEITFLLSEKFLGRETNRLSDLSQNEFLS